MTPKITIIGSGFGALTAVKKYRKLNKNAEITVISPKAELIYLPSLIWIPSGLRTRKDLSIDLTHFFAKQKVQHYQGLVTSISDDGRTVYTNKGSIKNDGLIIASGARFIKKLPGIENAITLCEGLDAAEQYKAKLDKMDGGTIALGFGGNPKEPAAMRGGPVFELLFGLDTLLKKQGRRDKFNLVFFSPAPKPGKRMGEKAVTELLKEMKKRNIKTYLGSKLKQFTKTKVITEAAEFDADLIIYLPGMTGPKWLADTMLPLSDGGMIKASPQCQVAGFNHTFVVGDSGSFEGPDWMPKQAHMADLQAEAAAINLHASLNNKPITQGFTIELVCIVDTLNSGILVYRSLKKSIILKGFFFHWAKRLFELMYLHQYK